VTLPRNDGWRRDLEDASVIIGLLAAKTPWKFKAAATPDEVRPDLEGIHPLENQSSMGSCQGFTITSCTERLYQIASGGAHEQLSNIFAYLASQRITGDQLYGRDSGSTISSGVQLSTQHGICPLELAPYPQPVRYPNARERQAILKQSNYAAGEPFKIRSSLGAVKSADHAIDLIGGGAVITIGMGWPPQIRDVDGRKTIVGPGGDNGGHAIAILGYKRDSTLIAHNSHGYWLDIEPSAFNRILRQRWTVAVGLSDMANPQPRDVSYLAKKIRNRVGNLPELFA